GVGALRDAELDMQLAAAMVEGRVDVAGAAGVAVDHHSLARVDAEPAPVVLIEADAAGDAPRVLRRPAGPAIQVPPVEDLLPVAHAVTSLRIEAATKLRRTRSGPMEDRVRVPSVVVVCC